MAWYSDWPEICGHTFLGSALGESSVVLDFGGSSAQFSHEVQAATGCRCYVVEATARDFGHIEETPWIKKYHYAIAGHDGPASRPRAPAPAIPWDALDAADDACELVEGVTLPTFAARLGLTHVDLIKVDIDGAEIAMFDATPDDFLQSVGQITVEFHDATTPAADIARIKQRMRTLGFACIVLTRHHHGDTLFLNLARLRLPSWKLAWLRLTGKTRPRLN